jgi:predicted HicB family RNase H-like nuclease
MERRDGKTKRAIMIKYKGYFAKVEFDDDANIFHGEVINLRDVITFEGETVKEIKQAFQDSVDDYLDFCARRGENPEKPFSGKFVVRVEPELHKKVAIEARKSGKSLNVWVNDAISKALKNNTQQGHPL